MTITKTTTLLTPAEYLTHEEQSETKSEYEAGVIIPMPGGTLEHSQIKGNVYVLLDQGIGDLDFRLCNSDIRVRTPDATRYYYPDISVVAGDPSFDAEWETAILTNPCLIVEVLSRSTAHRDRGSKFQSYTTIPSLREYLLIDQYSVSVVQWVRHPDDAQWHHHDYTNLDDVVTLVSVPVQLPLRRVYRRVTFAR